MSFVNHMFFNRLKNELQTLTERKNFRNCLVMNETVNS